MTYLSKFDVIHTTVYQHALADIQQTGAYCHAIVLDTAGFDPRSVNIQWAHIREAVSDVVGQEMMPLAFLFFAPRQAKQHGYTVATHPEKFLAIGHGKQTFGYGIVGQMPDSLVQCWSKQTGALAKGHLQKHKNVFDAAINGGKMLGTVRSPEQIASDFIPFVADEDDDGLSA